MKISLNELKQITTIININNISNDIIFDYLRIVKYNDDLFVDEGFNILFFPITISKEDVDDGWYDNIIDYRNKISEIVSKNPLYYYVIEKNMVSSMPSDSKYFVVDNIMEFVKKLFQKKLNEYSGKIICITGSVGKTTTVGFIKQVLDNKCLRIYSKRITPLILQNFIINFLTNDYEFLVLEASLWFKKHIIYFSKTLKPDLSIIINILPEHIGIDSINTVSDIVLSKLMLLEHSNNAIINYTDEELSKISFKNNVIYYNDIKVCDAFLNNFIFIKKINFNINPYIKTRLCLLEKTVAYEVGKFYGLSDSTILKRLNNALPVENRLKKEVIYNHEIIFDGDVSGVARIKELCDHFYEKSYLIIDNLSINYDEDEDYHKIISNFDKFNNVFIDKKYKSYFGGLTNVIYYNNLKFIEKLDKKAMIFFHYGSYYRIYNKFNIDNLEIDNE